MNSQSDGTGTVKADVGSLESTFGVLKSAEEVKDDKAISTFPDILMRQFTVDQVKVWLEKVSDGFQYDKFITVAVEEINTRLKKEREVNKCDVDRTNRRDRHILHSSSMFGAISAIARPQVSTKRVNGSLKRPASQISSSSNRESKDCESAISAGRILTRLNLFQTFNESKANLDCMDTTITDVAKLYKEAIIRRTKYEALKIEEMRVKEIEARRLIAETRGGAKIMLMERDINVNDEKKQNSHIGEISAVIGESDYHKGESENIVLDDITFGEDSFDLEDLVGGKIGAKSSFQERKAREGKVPVAPREGLPVKSEPKVEDDDKSTNTVKPPVKSTIAEKRKPKAKNLKFTIN